MYFQIKIAAPILSKHVIGKTIKKEKQERGGREGRYGEKYYVLKDVHMKFLKFVSCQLKKIKKDVSCKNFEMHYLSYQSISNVFFHRLLSVVILCIRTNLFLRFACCSQLRATVDATISYQSAGWNPGRSTCDLASCWPAGKDWKMTWVPLHMLSGQNRMEFLPPGFSLAWTGCIINIS